MDDAIPTQADWESERRWYAEMQRAYRHFYGLSFEEAVVLFKGNAVHYHEDMCWMPRACFPFYARALMAYLLSETSERDSDGANSFFVLVATRPEEFYLDESMFLSVEKVLNHLATRQLGCEADQSPNGGVAERAQIILAELQRYRPGT